MVDEATTRSCDDSEITFEERLVMALHEVRSYVSYRQYCKHEVDDTLQTIALIAWECRESYQECGVMVHWVKAIATNVVLAVNRSSRRNRDHSLEEMCDRSLFDPGDDCALLEEFMQIMSIDQSLGLLTTDEKFIVKCSCIDGIPYDDIARILHISPQATRQRKSRALKRLRYQA